jgi:small multidrug resistance pump
MTGWIFLAIAIIAEIVATTALRSSNGFTVLLPSIATVLGYGIAFTALAQALKSLDLGIAYAVWAGVGTATVAVIGIVVFDEPGSVTKAAGLALIVAGVVLLNVQGGH